jgi:hypothetical protein
MVSGQSLVFYTFARERTRSMVGIRLTWIGFILATIGWTAAIAINAFALGLWPLGLFLAANAIVVTWLASHVRISPN